MKRWSILAAILMLIGMLFSFTLAGQVYPNGPSVEAKLFQGQSPGIHTDLMQITSKGTYDPRARASGPSEYGQVEKIQAENLTLRSVIAALIVGFVCLLLWISLERLRQPVLREFKRTRDEYEEQVNMRSAAHTGIA